MEQSWQRGSSNVNATFVMTAGDTYVNVNTCYVSVKEKDKFVGTYVSSYLSIFGSL